MGQMKRITVWGWTMLAVSAYVAYTIVNLFVVTDAPRWEVAGRLALGTVIGAVAALAYFYVAARLGRLWWIAVVLGTGLLLGASWLTTSESLALGLFVGVLAIWFPHCWGAVGSEPHDHSSEISEDTLKETEEDSLPPHLRAPSALTDKS